MQVCYSYNGVLFEWDPWKNEINKEKHGISFEEIMNVFFDPNTLEFYDDKNSTITEERFILLGDIGNLVIVTVIFTERNNAFRIISARFAEPNEKEVYYENLAGKIK